ncbi:amidoligase enzyme protein [Rutstroemia sp. NJR-2017a BVV2]|nr:amidoligase enzyme protein [Rutstroemia sp. NJR-2017a BVV2]
MDKSEEEAVMATVSPKDSLCEDSDKRADDKLNVQIKEYDTQEQEETGNKEEKPECLVLRKTILRSSYPQPGSTGYSPRLTFGVEIEMAVASLRDICVDPEPGDERVAYGISRPAGSPPLEYDPRPAEFGSDAPLDREYRYEGLKCLFEHMAAVFRNAGLQVLHEATVKPLHERDENGDWITDCWIIGTDKTIECPDETVYDFHQIEIKSPVFYYSEAAVEEVRKVCALVSSTYRLFCNESMGLHVHVGNGVMGFDGRTLRNLFGILWTTEKWLETIHPTHRTRGNVHCQGFRTCSLLPFMFSRSENIESKTLEWIMGDSMPTKVKNILDLIKSHSGGYNFINLVSELNANSFKRTIEFRQHESTLNGERVVQWIHLCIGLVNLSAATETNELALRLRKLINTRQKSITVADVLKYLGLERSAEYYRQQVPGASRRKKMKCLWSVLKQWTCRRTTRGQRRNRVWIKRHRDIEK